MSTQKGIGLKIDQSDREFSVTTGSSVAASSILARFTNKKGEAIDLVTGLINLLVPEEDKITAKEQEELRGRTTIYLHDLQIRYDRFHKDSTNQFRLIGKISWRPEINFLPDDPVELVVEAGLDLRKQTGQRVTGEIYGLIQTPIQGLEFLSLGIALRRVRRNKETDDKGKIIVDNKTFFLIRIGKITFEAHFEKTGGDLNLEFRARAEDNLTMGEVITFFASLVDPSIEEYEFDPPWDFISRIPLTDIVKGLIVSFEYKKDTRKKSFKVGIKPPSTTIPKPFAPFIEGIEEFGLEFTSTPVSPGNKKSTRKVDFYMEGKFFGRQTNTRLNWNPVDGKPPLLPANKPAIFELRYLGLGQHVAFTQAANVNSIKDVMDALRGALGTNHQKLADDRLLGLGSPQKSFLAPGSAIEFSAESQWLIGLDVSLMRMLSLSLIFNDPNIYGLRIELDGPASKFFQGFAFEILYTKVSDTVGKYHGELVLPDKFRRMDFGAMTLILPGIIVDVYTNGDFGVDLGFPWNFNYTRSFGLEFFPFTGAGGFYLRKLSAATAKSVPQVKNKNAGVFNPVYEFGLGLRIGLGKSFEKGPLRAEIGITIQGIVEGVISWFRPTDGRDDVLYYKIKGGIQIVGRLYGSVDFVVISIEIEVIAKATILFLVEIYKDIDILLSAEVSVEATVTILGIEVEKKFEMKVEQQFTIASPNGYDAPWLKD